MVGKGLISLEEAKLKAVVEFAAPRGKKDVRTFLGLAGYYHGFVRDFLTLPVPFHDLTKKEMPDIVAWENEYMQAFQSMKAALVSDAVLMAPHRRIIYPINGRL